MEFDVVAGVALMVAAYAFTTYLVLRSRRTITLLWRKRLGSLREIIKEIDDGRSREQSPEGPDNH